MAAGVNPSIALSGVQPTNPLDTMGKVLNMKSLMQGQQLQQGQLQLQQMQIQSQQGLRKAFADSNGDPDKLMQLAPQYGVDPRTMLEIQQNLLTMKKTAAELDEKTIQNHNAHADRMNGTLQSILSLPDGQKQTAWTQAVNQGIQNGDVKPDEVTQQYPGDDQVRQFISGHKLQTQIFKEEMESRKANAEEWKEDPGSGTLRNVRTGQTMPGSQMLPMPADLAQNAGVPELAGKPVSPKFISNTRDAIEGGNSYQNAGGRLLLVDKDGNKLKDMGASTPVVTANINQGPFAAPLGGGVPSGVSGDAALQYMHPSMRAMVKAIGDGQMDFQTAANRMNPAAKANLTSAILSYNPNFNQGNFGIAQKEKTYMTSGEGGKTLNAFNTATEHLKLLSQQADALDNGNVQIINNLGNKFATATGNPAPTNFEMTKNAVAGEIAKTFKGQATEGEIAAINSTINNAMSSKQLKGAINTALSLMQSKRQALQQQYQQGVQAQPAFTPSSSTDPFAQFGGKAR